MLKKSIVYYWYRNIVSHIPILVVYNQVDKKRTKKTLLKTLREKKVPFVSYCLNGGKPEDAIVMDRFGLFFWQCYYVERGKKWDIRIFINQNQACFYIYYSILSIYKDNKNFKLNILESERKYLENFCYANKGFVKV